MTALRAAVSLLPAPRRTHAARRRVARSWGAGLAALSVGAIFSGMLMRASATGAGTDTASALADLQGQIVLTRTAIERERAALDRLRWDAETLELVRRRPEWTRLIAATARAIGSGGVIERIRLVPETPPRLTIVGWAMEQTGVASGVLVLERTGVLREVRLVESRRGDLSGVEAVRFEIEAVVAASEGAP